MKVAGKGGRPRKYSEKPESYGMNVTKEGKYKIKILAQLTGKPANEALMDLVDEKLTELGIVPGKKKRLSIDDLLRLPEKERNTVIEQQMNIIARFDDVIEDGFDIVED